MKIVYFVQAVTACWNNGNAHFLRGVGRALQSLGHQVLFAEPAGNWCESNLIAHEGEAAMGACQEAVRDLAIFRYDPEAIDIESIVDDAALVIVHEWNNPGLVARIGHLRRRGGGFTLFFHDTHHRAVTAPQELDATDLSSYDGVLAFGVTVADIYRRRGWGARAFVWHEAADLTRFFPMPDEPADRDLVWIGNWGDEERSTELREFLIAPSHLLELGADIFGVRYPDKAKAELREKGVAYRGWLPNHAAPREFARHRLTVHVPRRPYAQALAGVPTIRVFEALACGIPLVSAPWQDSESLFPEDCFRFARNGDAMRDALRSLLHDEPERRALARRGREIIVARHSCLHRARELLQFHAGVSTAIQTEDAI